MKISVRSFEKACEPYALLYFYGLKGALDPLMTVLAFLCDVN